MMPGDDVLIMTPARRVEVFTGKARRRRWSAEAKAQIVAESYASSVAEAAARHDLSRTQIFSWRREARLSSVFARIEVDDSAAAPPGRGLIEVRMMAGQVSIEPGADPAVVTAIVMALRGSR